MPPSGLKTRSRLEGLGLSREEGQAVVGCEEGFHRLATGGYGRQVATR